MKLSGSSIYLQPVYRLLLYNNAILCFDLYCL